MHVASESFIIEETRGMCSPSYQVGQGLFVEHRQGGTPLSSSHVHRRIANCWSKPCKETKRKQCCQRKRVRYGPGLWSRCKSWPAASILNPPSPPGTTSATKHARNGYVHTSPQQHPDMLQHHHMPHTNSSFCIPLLWVSQFKFQSQSCESDFKFQSQT